MRALLIGGVVIFLSAGCAKRFPLCIPVIKLDLNHDAYQKWWACHGYIYDPLLDYTIVTNSFKLGACLQETKQ